MLGRARPRREAGRDPRRPRAGRRPGARPRTRSRRTSSSTASPTRASCASTTTPTRSTPPRCWRRSSASCPATTSGCAPRVNAIADELTEHGFVLRYRTDETDDGLSGQGGDVPDLLVLARVGARDRRRAAAGPRPDGAPAADRLAARPVRRGVRRRHRPAPRQLPAGVLPPRADRGRGANHRPRAAWRSTDDGFLRRDHHRDGRRRRHARTAPRAVGQADPPARARRLASPRAVRTGPRTTSSSTTATSRRTPGTTRRASRSSPRSTTSSAERPSSTAPRSTGCARRTSASCATTTASRRRGRSPTTSSSPTTRWPSSSTRCTARAVRTRPSRRRARRTRSRRSRTSRGSSSSRTTSPRPATTRSTRRAGCG